MKKLLFSIFILFLSINSFATHLLGGELYYDKVPGTNQYEFTLLLYRDALGALLPNSANVNTTVPGTSSLSLLKTNNSKFVNMSCGYSNVEVGEYKGTISITGPIPAAGYTFTWSSCCRTSYIDNLASMSASFAITTTMLPGSDNSARFYTPASFAGVTGSSQYFNHAAYDPDNGDSIYVSFANAKQQSSTITNIGYSTGYDKDNPFGLTVPTTLDQNSGLIGVSNVPIGMYTVVLKVRSYTNGNLTSVMHRDVPFFFENQGVVPSISLNNIAGTAVSTQSGNSYFFEMSELDQLSFDITGTTTQMNPGSIPADIHLAGYGDILDTNTGIGGNCSGTNCANFIPLNGSFTNPIFTNGSFSFSPDTSMVPAGLPHVYKVLGFNTYTYDSCNVARMNSINVTIKVNNSQHIYSVSNMFSCKGTGVNAAIQGDNANIVWSPAHGVTDTTSATTLLDPDSTTTYTVTHVPSGTTINVTVNVDEISANSFVLNNNGAILKAQLIDSNQVVDWYYNGSVVATGIDSLEMLVSGYYWATITKGNCMIYSDTVKAVITNKVSNSTNTGGGINTNANTGQFTFSMINNGNTLDDLQLVFPTLGAGKTNATVTVNLMEASTLLKTVSAIQINDFIWEAQGFNVLLDPSKSYTIEVVTDFTEMVVYEPVSMPFTEDNGLLEVTSGSYVENGNTVSGAYPYVNFVFTSPLSLDENDLGYSIYPNPINDQLKLELRGQATLELYTVQGHLVYMGDADGNTNLDVSFLKQGVYFYRIKIGDSVNTGKLIKN